MESKKKTKWLDEEPQLINELFKQKDVKNLWKQIRNTVCKKTVHRLYLGIVAQSISKEFTVIVKRFYTEIYLHTMSWVYRWTISEFALDEIENYVNKLRIDKAPDYDDVPAGYYKLFCPFNKAIEKLADGFNDLKNKETFSSL